MNKSDKLIVNVEQKSEEFTLMADMELGQIGVIKRTVEGKVAKGGYHGLFVMRVVDDSDTGDDKWIILSEMHTLNCFDEYAADCWLVEVLEKGTRVYILAG